MSETKPGFYILPAEHVGNAEIVDDTITIGGVTIPLARGSKRQAVGVYVRRSSDDLSVMEIHLAFHDGLATEAMGQQNLEAGRFPLGPKAYWRAEMKDLDDVAFEEWWSDDE